MSSNDHELCFMPGGEPSSPASDPGVEQQHDALLGALQLQRDAYMHLPQHQFDQLQALLFEYSDVFCCR
jgi:hypothetical protein